MNLTNLTPWTGSAFLLLTVISTPHASSSTVNYREDVRPILNRNCVKCHGGPRAKQGIHMDDKDRFQEHIGPGGLIVPGNPKASELYLRITMPAGDPDRMPRKAPPLSPEQVNIIRSWIAQGASLEDTPPSTRANVGATELDPEALQNWMLTSGRTFQAYFVELDGSDAVVLRSSDPDNPKTKSFALSLFTGDSRDLMAKLAEMTSAN